MELLAVVAFGQILRDGILSPLALRERPFLPAPGLPGAAPVERALMDGVTETGVTIMRMEAGLDTGPVYATRSVPVTEEDDGGSLTARLSALGGPLLVDVIDDIAAGRAAPAPQPEEGVSLAPKIGPDDRALDFSRPAAELERRVRALSPHIGATCESAATTFKIWAARARAEDAPAGLAAEGGRLVAGCGRGSLEILELQPPGRARMDTGAFLRGWRGALDLGSVGA